MESLVDGNGGGSRLVMTELSNIKELVKQLDVHLGGCPDPCKHLAAQIFAVTERSIGMIRSGHFDDGPKRSAADAGIDSPPFPTTPSPLMRANKKRKTMEKGTRRIRVRSAGGGADAQVDDGYSWRKYGQKEILGAQNPRGYYRCTYQKSRGCAATKQVQRADEDPSCFDVTYHGTHTCAHKAANVQPATPNPDARSLLQSLSSRLTVSTEGLTSGPQQSTPFGFSSPAAVSGPTPPGRYPTSTASTPEDSFGQGASLSPSSRLELSPATSGSSYSHSMAPFQEDWTMVSALIAAASMPEPPTEAEDTAFSMDGVELLDFDVSIFLA